MITLLLKSLSGSTFSSKSSISSMQKFQVHFRRPSDYKGEYGFDWLRDEYIYPIEYVTLDNSKNNVNKLRTLCINPTDLKTEYKKDLGTNAITPFHKEYFPAWLAIFPHTTTAQFKHGSNMHKKGVNLDLEIEEIDALIKGDTELTFVASNNFIKVSPTKLQLKDLLTTKKTKNLGGGVIKNYYTASKKINIKCVDGALNKHEYVSVMANSYEVGRLMLYKNDVIPKAEIVVVNVITDRTKSASLKEDNQYLFKYKSFNQALIRAEVSIDTNFDLVSLNHDPNVSNFLRNCNYLSALEIRENFKVFYENMEILNQKGIY